jgi:uncharacterized repeat protein (TIGR01451 family)
MRKLKIVLAASAIVVGLGAMSLQAKQEPVTLVSKSYKEVIKVDKHGNKKVVLEETKKVIPGDYVVYKNSISNNSDKDVNDMVLNNAIPKHTEYVADSAKCDGECEILFSVDGGKVFDAPENLMVKVGDKERLALPKEYTNVRWILTSALKSKSVTSVSFKTRLQ